MNIKMHGYYDFFSHHHPVDGEPYIDCYSDNFVATEEIHPNSIALMIEPRPIEPRGYRFLLQDNNWQKFKYIFTHDSELLQLPNAKFVTNFSIYDWSDIPKTKFCSMISSDKEMCELHIARKKLARELKGKVDVFGTIDGGERVDTYTAHAPYRYAVIMENYIDDYWFTEKILNCFANKVVPIYYGARKIYEFFNGESILRMNSIDGLKDCVNVMSGDYGIYWYESRHAAIEDNYRRVGKYENLETWFFNEYGGLLNDLHS